jgi:glutamate formiminotransferase
MIAVQKAAASANASRLVSPTAQVACNVYVSVGGMPSHAPLLLDLLRQTQEHCAHLVAISADSGPPSTRSAAVVHAYADPVYNRSSFHLAGTAPHVASLASKLAADAIQSIRQASDGLSSSSDVHTESVSHPNVGLVDHVAVMPITGRDETSKHAATTATSTTPSGLAARMIGDRLSALNVQVFYYGTAHPQAIPLAIVRKEQTSFFHSGGLSLDHGKGGKRCSHPVVEVATVGAPPEFVENYNIRLTRHCTLAMARSLTRRVRERDGGLAGVEALTLPYSEGRWEVACNLLRPTQASANDIQTVVDEWVNEQRWQQQKQVGNDLVEQGYRVGTTSKLCLEALSILSLDKQQIYDDSVRGRLQGYLRQL